MKNKETLTLLNLANDTYINEADPENAKYIYSTKSKRRS